MPACLSVASIKDKLLLGGRFPTERLLARGVRVSSINGLRCSSIKTVGDDAFKFVR